MKFDKYKEQGAYHHYLYGNDRIYTAHVDKIVKMVKGKKILDIGAGDGLITQMVGAIGIDDNEIAVKLAQERDINVTFASVYFLFGSYDSVLLLDVLEHLEYPEWALREIKKVLKGELYIVTPPAKKDGLHDKYHFQEWTPDGLIEFMYKNGFQCKSLETVDKYVRMYGIFE